MPVAIVLAAAGVAAVASSGSMLLHQRRVAGPIDREGLPSSWRDLQPLWWVPALSVVLAVVLPLLWNGLGLEPVYQVRVVVFLSFLVPLAVIDAREGIVPNRLLLALLALRVPLWLWEASIDWQMFLGTLRGEVASSLVVGAFFLLMRLLPKGGLGMGDVKLFALMPLFLGPQLALTSILGSLIVSFCFAVWGMATGRKARTDSFPMVPSIAVGTIAAVLFVSVQGAI